MFGASNTIGSTVSSSQLNTPSFYAASLGWCEDIWDFSELDVANGKLPRLKKNI
jgi:hypothetical protein